MLVVIMLAIAIVTLVLNHYHLTLLYKNSVSHIIVSHCAA